MNEEEAIRKNMEQIGNRLRTIGYTYDDYFKMCKVIGQVGRII